MSTRAVILIPEAPAAIYVHSDGYPEGMLPWLTDFNQQFTKNRGHDPTYKLAQCLRFSAFEAKKHDLHEDRYLGWGVYSLEDTQHLGQQYTYTLHPDGTVTVKEGP